MRVTARSLAGLLAGLSLAGCVPGYVNLTPGLQPRNEAHVYPFEVQWSTIRRGANSREVRAYVMVADQLYPMTRVPNTVNRFEGLVPLPPGKTHIPYRYKFDYHYPMLPDRVESSDWSPEYLLVLRPEDAR